MRSAPDSETKRNSLSLSPHSTLQPPTHLQGANLRQRPVTPYDSRSFYLTTFFQITKQLPNSLSNRVSPSPYNASQDFPNVHFIMLGYTLVLPLAILASTASAQLNGLRATIPGEPSSLTLSTYKDCRGLTLSLLKLHRIPPSGLSIDTFLKGSR